MGSDWPVSSGDVLDQISVAIRRKPPGDDMPPTLTAPERLTLHQALAAFTVGSATINGVAGRTGRIRVGNVADLVVLDQDPFGAADPAGIDVSTTMASGEIVFDREGGG
jgi:predicted amidohydrolase YtcJ